MSNLEGAAIVDLCGGYSSAVDAITELGRALWDLSFETDQSAADKHTYKIVNEAELLKRLRGSDAIGQVLLDHLRSRRLSWEKRGETCFPVSLFHPMALPREFLADIRPEHELRYFVMRGIRNRSGSILSPETSRVFQALATAMNHRLNSSGGLTLERAEASDSSANWYYNVGNPNARSPVEEPGLVPYLIGALKDKNYDPGYSDRMVKLFVECCRAVGYIRPSYRAGRVNVRTAQIDAEFMLSNLFGLPTDIPGFDELFGGGGVMLVEAQDSPVEAHDVPVGGPESPAEKHDSPTSPGNLKGRAVLVVGRYGTGKTLLSLQLAVEVANKGGLSWVMSLEQPWEECLYVLASMGKFPDPDRVVVANDTREAFKALMERGGEKGALVILKELKDSFEDFLMALSENAKYMKNYPLRLITVDPVNSIVADPDVDRTKLRMQTLKAIESVKADGANMVLVAEEGDVSGSSYIFEQNIADTVIHLLVDPVHGYAQRFVEIRKSRLQREQRGRHPFSIVPGEGIRIYPSPAAVSARIRPRGVRSPGQPLKFGFSPLDKILGEGGINVGDVIVLQGAKGLFKTALGLLFLLSGERTGQHDSKGLHTQQKLASFLVSTRDEAGLKHGIAQARRHAPISGQERYRVKILALPRGYVTPSYILEQLEDKLRRASREEKLFFGRVMVDNVAHWEMSSPIVRDDVTFGDTLVDFLRRQQVTSLLTCGKLPRNGGSTLQQSIIDNADCLIEFDRIEFRGASRAVIKVVKSRGMAHRPETYEIALGPRGLEIKPALLRVGLNGQVSPVSIRLFLHAETRAQQEYNSRFEEFVRASISRDTKIESQVRLRLGKPTSAGAPSSVDELQVVQLDEFQVPDASGAKGGEPGLYTFPLERWEDHQKEWGTLQESKGDDVFLPRLVNRVRGKKDFTAVPFYENLSLLAYRPDRLAGEKVESWESLEQECEDWERKNPNAVFFDFPRTTPEHYNCLFFEIFLSYSGHRPPAQRREYSLKDWLEDATAIKAARVFRALCRRTYLSGRAEFGDLDPADRDTKGPLEPGPAPTDRRSHRGRHRQRRDKRQIELDTGAVVWRHWYSTLCQMMSRMSPEKRAQVRVCPLPGGVTIAGEWYLGIPAHSAYPDVGLDLIKSLTSRQAELDRVRLGVGLPTRKKLYNGASGDTELSRYLTMTAEELGALAERAFRRSSFSHYCESSDTLAYYLRRIIEIEEGTKESIEGKAMRILKSAQARLEYIQTEYRSSEDKPKKPRRARGNPLDQPE